MTSYSTLIVWKKRELPWWPPGCGTVAVRHSFDDLLKEDLSACHTLVILAEHRLPGAVFWDLREWENIWFREDARGLRFVVCSLLPGERDGLRDFLDRTGVEFWRLPGQTGRIDSPGVSRTKIDQEKDNARRRIRYLLRQVHEYPHSYPLLSDLNEFVCWFETGRFRRAVEKYEECLQTPLTAFFASFEVLEPGMRTRNPELAKLIYDVKGFSLPDFRRVVERALLVSRREAETAAPLGTYVSRFKKYYFSADSEIFQFLINYE